MSGPGAKREPLAELRAEVARVAAEIAEPPSTPAFDRPPEPGLGDYSSNAAMMLAGVAGSPPREVAEDLAGRLGAALGDSAARVEVAGPGFVNLHLSDRWLAEALGSLLAATASEPPVSRVVDGELRELPDPLLGLGPCPEAVAQRYLVEFVSANPTGPLTAASGRHAAYGDSLCLLLEALGHEVWREYYVNDAGGQIERFAASVAAAMTGAPPPEDGYAGEYVGELARRLACEGTLRGPGGSGDGEVIELPVDPGDLGAVARAAVAAMLEGIASTARDFGVRFDRWASERALHQGRAVLDAVEELAAAGRTFEQDGAVWLRTTDFGDDKDRVLVRSGGEPTYFAADVAYHARKLGRGFDRLVDVLGADHHGYLARIEAAIAALGAPAGAFEAQIMQMVSIVAGGQRAQMSKRSGEFVTLGELIGEIGSDATRFFMLQRSHETPFDLDVELAKRESSDNPVYYVQYAHARIASILRKAAHDGAVPGAGRPGDGPAGGGGAADGGGPAGGGGNEAASNPATGSLDSELGEVEAAILAAGLPGEIGSDLEPAERDLVKRLLELPDEVREAADRRAPHRICAYATAIASDFHAFYRDCKVVGAGDPDVERFRLALCLVAKRTLAATLGLLGTSAPERM